MKIPQNYITGYENKNIGGGNANKWTHLPEKLHKKKISISHPQEIVPNPRALC